MSDSDAIVTALGLYRYDIDHPGAQVFGEFFEATLHHFELLGIRPNFLSVGNFGGEEADANLEPLDVPSEKRSVLKRLRGADLVSVVAAPPNSKWPDFDAFSDLSFSYLPSHRELILSATFQQRCVNLDSTEFLTLLRTVIELHRWDFGFGFRDLKQKEPALHIAGGSNGTLTDKEEEKLNIWYASRPEMRVRRIRDVYPYNIINETQLATDTGKGLTLWQFIDRHPASELTRLTDYGLHLWKVSNDEEVDRLRQELGESPALIS